MLLALCLAPAAVMTSLWTAWIGWHGWQRASCVHRAGAEPGIGWDRGHLDDGSSLSQGLGGARVPFAGGVLDELPAAAELLARGVDQLTGGRLCTQGHDAYQRRMTQPDPYRRTPLFSLLATFCCLQLQMDGGFRLQLSVLHEMM